LLTNLCGTLAAAVAAFAARLGRMVAARALVLGERGAAAPRQDQRRKRDCGLGFHRLS